MNIKVLIALYLLHFIFFKGVIYAQKNAVYSSDDIRQITKLATTTVWKTIKKDDGITIKSRWLAFEDTLKTREISLNFIVKSDLDKILLNLKQPDKIISWNHTVKQAKLLEQYQNIWITHTLYDIPYPLSQQDLVVKNILIRADHHAVILMSALPDYIRPLMHVKRQRFYYGKWELNSIRGGQTEVKLSILSFSKSSIPRFIRDPIIQNSLFNSFVNLKKMLS